MLELIDKGGPVMWFLLGAGLVASVVFLERLFHLHRADIKSEDFLKGVYTVLKRGNVAEAVSICEGTPGPVAYITRMAVLHHDEKKEDIQKVIEEAGLVEVPRLERNLNLLATIAKIAPLGGLLGTVLGMLRIFMVMQQDAPLVQMSNLAGGMVEALLTTIAGLVIAIPAYAGYNFLIGRVETIMLDMEKSSIEILSVLSEKTAFGTREP
jgi:biopolymer transport protein ExbB